MDHIRNTPKLDALTGLRYVAAMCILFCHMAGAFGGEWWSPYFAALGGVGMPLFFVLSGFLMSYNYQDAFGTTFKHTLRRFYVARIARIYPVYLVILLLWFSFVANFFHDLLDRPHNTIWSLAHVLTLTQSWFHAPVYSDYMHSRTITLSHMGIAWSVSVEAFFYTVFPIVAIVLLRFVKRPRHVALAGTGVYLLMVAYDWACTRWFGLSPTGQLDPFGLHRWMIYLCPYARFGEFLIGCLAGQLYLMTAATASGNTEKRVGQALTWLSAVGLFVVVELVLLRRTSVFLFYLQSNILVAPVSATLIYCLARYPSILQKLLAQQVAVLLGEASYCIYLAHPLAQSLFTPRLLGEADFKQWWIVLYNNVAMVATLHFMCLGLYRYVEFPMRTIIRDRLTPGAPKIFQQVATTQVDRRAAAA